MKHLLFFLACWIISSAFYSQVPIKSKKNKVNEVELYYETHGNRALLLPLHDYPQSSILWKEFVRISKEFLALDKQP